jgi:hypothetical protein
MQLNNEATSPPGFGQWAGMCFCVAVALAAASLTVTFNYNFGAQLGPDFAAVFVFVALIVVGLPLMANANGGWNIGQRVAWALAVALSVTAASSHILEMQANAWTAAEAGKTKAGNHAADEARARAALGRITETSTVSSLAAMVKAADGKHAEADTAAKKDKITCAERKVCRNALADLNALRDRLGQAEAREKLAADLASLSAAGQGVAPVKTLGMGESLATLIGVDAAKANNAIMVFVTVLILILLEVAAGVFSGEAGRQIAKIAAARRTVCKPRPQRAETALQRAETDDPTTETFVKPIPNVAKPAAKGAVNRDYWIERLRRDRPDLAAEIGRGTLSVYRATVEVGWRKAATPRKWSASEYLAAEAA